MTYAKQGETMKKITKITQSTQKLMEKPKCDWTIDEILLILYVIVELIGSLCNNYYVEIKINLY